MIYSSWNQQSGQFDYYEAQGAVDAKLNAPKPKHLAKRRTLGATVEQAAWPLPKNARYVGSGTEAIGAIASSRAHGSLGDDSSSDGMVKAGLLVVSAFLLWKYVVKAPRRRHA